MREQQIVPALRHHPRAPGQRPRPVGDGVKRGMHLLLDSLRDGAAKKMVRRGVLEGYGFWGGRKNDVSGCVPPAVSRARPELVEGAYCHRRWREHNGKGAASAVPLGS